MTEGTYKRYKRDIPKRTRKGKIATEFVDGEYRIIYEHRKGEIVLGAAGNPIHELPSLNPVPDFGFLNRQSDQPHRRYNDTDLYWRSPEGLKEAIKGLSDEDLSDVLRSITIESDARFQGIRQQLVRSKYLPTCIVDMDGGSQYLIYNDDGDIIEALPESVYHAKYADKELY